MWDEDFKVSVEFWSRKTPCHIVADSILTLFLIDGQNRIKPSARWVVNVSSINHIIVYVCSNLLDHFSKSTKPHIDSFLNDMKIISLICSRIRLNLVIQIKSCLYFIFFFFSILNIYTFNIKNTITRYISNWYTQE